MRLLKNFAIALTPFLLNGDLVKVPEIQDPSILQNSGNALPVPVPETPLILNVEIPAAKPAETPVVAKEEPQAAPIVTKIEEPKAPETPVVAKEEPKVVPAAAPVQAAPIVTKIEEPKAPETPVVAKEEPKVVPAAAPVQAAPIVTKIEEPKAPETPVVAKEEPKVVPAAAPVQAAPIVTKIEEPKAPETPVVAKEEPKVVPAAAPVQAAPIVTKIEEPKAPETPITTTPETGKPEPMVQEPMTNQMGECLSPFRALHVDVRHTEANGVGYNDGYTTVEGFGIWDLNSCFMPFLDLRGHVFNDGRLAGNVGIGERTYIPSINHFFGLYVYYDVRQSSHDLTVNQVSPGIEILGKRMEYRVNGYFPVGKTESDSYGTRFDKFENNRMLIKRRKKYAMTGADGEMGVHITQSTRHDVYAGVGPYYFTADPFSAWGGKARVMWRYQEYVSLEASYSYDHLFKNIFQGTVSFIYPFGGKLKRTGKNCPNMNDLSLSRIAFAPYRFEIPVVKRKTHREVARNANTGAPLQVWFVNNMSSSLGTYESPFPTLAQAQNASGPNDMIYVLPGDGTTTGMNAGIVLQNGQTLFGSGIAHPYRTEQGRVLIPAFSSTAPTLTNAGSIVTLANGNEVSGLNLLVTQVNSNAINGTGRINGANINRNTISGNVNFTGVNIIGGGTILVSNNQVTGPTNPTSFGVNIQNLEQTSLDIEVRNNTISGFNIGIGVVPLLNPTMSSGNVLISGNVISNFNIVGISYGTGMPNGLVRILNNMVLNNAGAAGCISIAVILNQAPNAGTYFINNNTIITTTPANSGASLGIGASINLDDSARATFKILNNNILAGNTGVGTAGISLSNANLVGTPDRMCVSLSANTVTLQVPTSNGLTMSAGNGTINVDDFSNNLFPNMVTSGAVNFVAPGTCSP